MIQRIQTLFLLVAAALITCLFFCPFVDFGNGAGIDYTDIMPMTILLVVITFIACINIFLYRRRMVQIRLCMLNSLLLLAFQGYIIYYIATYNAETAASGGVFSLTAAFPLIAAILTFMALRYIARDEAMVKAMDRLR